MTKTEISEEALKLPVEERLSFAEKLWDSVEEDAPSLPLYDWQKKILEERLEAARQNPDAWLTWEEVKARVTASLTKRRGHEAPPLPRRSLRRSHGSRPQPP